MKRAAWLLVVMLYVGSSWAQQYRFEFDFSFVFNNDRRFYLDGAKARTQSGNELDLKSILRLYQAQANIGHIKNHIDYNAAYGPVRALGFTTSRQEEDSGIFTSWWNTECSSGFAYNTFPSCVSPSTVSIDWHCLIRGGSVVQIVDIATYPLITIDSKTTNKQGQVVKTTLLPEDDKVVIKATRGFKTAEYNWQYATRKDSTWASGKWNYSYNWLAIPRTLAPDSIFNASAKELLGSQVSSLYKKNVYVRMELSCNRWTDILGFTVMPSAPHIVSATYDMPVCNGEASAWIKLKFDRALYSDEKLYYALKSNREYVDDPLTIDPQTLEATIESLPADLYNLSLQGTIPINNRPEYTYTEGATHYYNNLTIPQRPKVTFATGQEAVHCYDGSDGRIWVTAQGGVGKYYADLVKADDPSVILQQITINGGETVRFANLPTGSYIVQLTDTNYCQPTVPEQAVTVLQPAAPLQLYGFQYQEPLGWGRSDGEAWINIAGGTGAYTLTWTNEAGTPLTPEPLITTGGDRQSRVKGLKKGKYYIYVTDQNFPLVDPKTQANECGCVAVDSIFVDEPPKLLIDISERHYITCHGDNDGIIVAHGRGGRPYLPADNKPLPYDYKWYKITTLGDSLYTHAGDSILSDIYSGHYKVNITDRNGIESTSLTFHLVQPDPLVVITNVLKQVQCDGESSGEAEVIVTGGTEPYFYFWETGDTTRVVKGLPKGIYSVFVRDGRYLDSQIHYCTQEAYAEIQSPNGMEIAATIHEPSCYSNLDGEIEITVTGGITPYIYRWEDETESASRTALPAGTYTVLVTDAAGCSISGKYTLREPEELLVNLGNDLTLCRERSISLVDSLGTGGVTYRWTKGNEELSTDSTYTASAAGTYRLTITNETGCTAYDEITVTISDDEMVTDFVVASKIPNNSPVYAINIIRMSYDKVEWMMPKEAVVMEKSADRVQFSIARNGFYTIGLAGYKGACRDILYKTIEVTDKGSIDEYNDSEPFLRKFIVTPNPDDGTFKVSIELREAADYSLTLTDSQERVIETKNIVHSTGEETSFGIPTAAGTYQIRFASKESASVFKMMLN
jgi:hypothetical protein